MWEDVEKIKSRLDEALSTLRRNGIEWAKAERDYRTLKSKEIMRLKSEGYPTTLILDVVKGLDEVAELDFKRNAALVVYKANVEALLVKKIELKTAHEEQMAELGNQ